jgi:cytochrome c556
MKRTVLAMVAVGLGIGAVMAQSDPIAQRKQLMKSNGQNSAAVNRMVRGEDPFDAAKASAAFTAWSENAPKLLPLFASAPPEGADSRALPKIWEAKADFEKRLNELGKAATDNKGKVATLEELKVAYPAVNKVCNDCHELYRRPQQPQGGQKK